MSTPTNPFEIARETLKQLAVRRTPPTPDNYLTLYHEIAGTRPGSKKPEAAEFPDKQLRSLAAALPKSSPDQLRLARLLDEAVKNSSWDDYRKYLADFVSGLVDSQRLTWGDLIADVLRQAEAKHPGLTTARKRESLDHVLNNSASNPEILFKRLQNLLRAWGNGKTVDTTTPEDESAAGDDDTAAHDLSSTPPASVDEGGALLPELRELFAFTLEATVATQLVDSPALATDARQLADEVRRAQAPEALSGFLERLKRFAYKLDLLTEDQAELRRSLLELLRLLVENVHELVVDDVWLNGQIDIVRDIIDKPLSQRTIDDAERRLKEVLFKQSQLKSSLRDARDAIKHLLAGFIDQLALFSDATSDYHGKIGECAEKITAANDLSELESVITEVMKETRNIQLSTEHARDELRSTQQKVQESEARIQQLEKELEATSNLVRHDQLTGVLNRRGLEDMFNKEMARSQRHDTVLCVALLDIDNFKKLNDAHGHDVGDQALIHLAQVCRETLRPQDTVARYGGEEFIILLPETPLDDAAAVLTRLQRELTKRFFLGGNEKILITFSAGVTQMTEDDTQATVIKRSDEAMYNAKQTGKNRVVKSPAT
ncbi:MAG: GGDEF domain-containing protein [Dechloromonas sp.]|nr:GGDEF domain-containing protein [Dechloromonas sp.]